MERYTAPRLGWIGLGSMGIGMAKNLQTHLKATGAPSLAYTNRTMSRGLPLDAIDAVPCDSITQLAQRSDIIFISVSDDVVLTKVVAEIVASGDITGKAIVDTSTVHPDCSVAASANLLKSGAVFVAAPVFGASPLAESGELLFAVAGPAPAINLITPFIKGVMGRAVINLGEDALKASLLKTAG